MAPSGRWDLLTIGGRGHPFSHPGLLTCSSQHRDPQGLSAPLVSWAFHPLPTLHPPRAGDRHELWTCCFTNSAAFVRRRAGAWAEPQFPHLPSPLPRSGQDQVGVWLGRGAPGQGCTAWASKPVERGELSECARDPHHTQTVMGAGCPEMEPAVMCACCPLPGCICKLFGEGSWFSTGATTCDLTANDNRKPAAWLPSLGLPGSLRGAAGHEWGLGGKGSDAGCIRAPGGARLGVAAGVGAGPRGVRVLRNMGFLGDLGEGLTSELCLITPPSLHSLIHSTEAY